MIARITSTKKPKKKPNMKKGLEKVNTMEAKKVRVAIYARVSTDSQDTENQLIVLKKWVSERGFENAYIFSENESAWRDGHQLQLSALLNHAYHHRFDTVVVWALDRLTRGGPLQILTLIDRLKRSGVRVISYQEPWTEAPGQLADILYAITGWVAQMESQRRSERTKAGLSRLKAQGKQLGRPPGSLDKKKRQKRVAKIHSQYFTPEGEV
jgi:putative DNA-invertase from lambdoid prophage Rac